MSRFRMGLLTGLVLFLVMGASYHVGRASEDGSTAPLIIDPPSQMIMPAIQVTDLEQIPARPRGITAAPASDSCTDATPLTLSLAHSADGSATLTNAFTEQGSDPSLSCMWGTPPRIQGYRTAWFRFVAGNTAEVVISTRGTGYDTVVAVYSGNCDNLLQLSCSDDFGGFSSQVRFQAVRNKTYFVEVADWQPGISPEALLRFSSVMESLDSRWAQRGNIPLGGVSRHALASLGSDVFLLGGQTRVRGIPAITTQIQHYNTATGGWAELSRMPAPGLSNTTAVQISGKIYIPGGFNGNTSEYDRTHWVYDIAADFWSTTSSIPANLLPDGEPFAWASAAAEPGSSTYFLTGGLASQPALDPDAKVSDRVYRFDATNNQWQLLLPMSTKRYAHTAVWVPAQNKGLCVAGGLSTAQVNGDPVTELLIDGECYNPSSGAGWQRTAPLNFPRYNAGSAVGPDGNWYIFGGLDTAGAVAETEVYDPILNSWRLLDSSFSLGGLPDKPAIVWPRGVFVGNNLWVFGGNDFPERRVVSAFESLPLTTSTIPLAMRVMIPVTAAGAGANFLEFADPLALNAPATGHFLEPTQFNNPYFFDWFEFGRATVILDGIPSSSNFNLAVYDSQKRLLGKGSDFFGSPKSVSLTLAPGRYYAVVERHFPKDIPDPNVYYTIVLRQES